MNRHFLIFTFLLSIIFSSTHAQKQSYFDSIQKFQRMYVDSHEVVKKDDKKYLQFFPIDTSMRIWCSFIPAKNAKWFSMKTTGSTSQVYRKFGLLKFKIRDKEFQLNMYQSQSLLVSEEYSDYLFIPFTDITSGNESYAGGRYIDQRMGDIRNNKLLLDFNKAYNPYCAYATGYNCPIPPAENDLPVLIKAGEKAYGKPH